MVYRQSPQLHLFHLEQRMRQSDDWSGAEPLSSDAFNQLLRSAIDDLDVDQERSEVEPFIKQPEQLAIGQTNSSAILWIELR